MRGVNKVIIFGNTGNNPEVSQFQNGGSVATIAVATSEKYQNKQTGEWVENTEWHRVKAFGKLAEIIAQYVRKGTPVYIEGKLKTDKYTDKNGIERYATNIIADQMQMLGGNQNAQQNNGGYQQQSQPQPSPYAQAALNTAQNVVQNTPVGQAINQQFANGQQVPPAYQNNPQFAPQNQNQQQPQFQNNMQGEPKPSSIASIDDIPFSALNGQLAHLI